MTRPYLGIATVMLVLLLGGSLSAGQLETVNETVNAEGAKRLVIDCDFGAGELIIVPGDIADAAEVEITYDPRKFRHDIDYHTRNDVGYLALESSTRSSRSLRNTRNEWLVTLSTRYPTELSLDFGACEAEIDLGGVPLTELSIDIGAASGVIDFSKRNPERCKEIDIDIGASSVEVGNLGNANFEFLSFSGGAASTELDFRGEYEGRCEVTLDIGLGSADVILPDGLPVRIETDGGGWFSDVDFHGGDIDEMDDGVYESPDFEDAETSMTLELDIGMGSVDIYWK